MLHRSEIRRDYFLPQEVIISPGRDIRPQDNPRKSQIDQRTVKSCQFCPEKLDYDNVVELLPAKSDHNWRVATINNIYPAVELDNKRAFGKQEVIIDTPDHQQSLADLSVKELAVVLTMYAQRTRDLGQHALIDYVLCFKNYGREAGASLEHSHSQVFASKLLPMAIRAELSAARRYRRRTGCCPQCDIIAKEIACGERLIWQDQNAVVIAPYASRFRYEAWILPRRHQDNIGLASRAELLSLASGLSIILKQLQAWGIAYNLCLHQVISATDQHFTIKIQPRTDIWAGVEIGAGLIVNPVSPEQAADLYRASLVKSIKAS